MPVWIHTHKTSMKQFKINIRFRWVLFNNHAKLADYVIRSIGSGPFSVMYVINHDLIWLRIHQNEDVLENVSDRLSLPNEKE